MRKARIAIYARYSSDLQRPTSIEDQFRTCAEHLNRLGYDTTDVAYFRDEAISGKSSKVEKREEFKRLIEEWRAGKLDVVTADEVSRLARGPKELYGMLEILENTESRLLTADNVIDSDQPHFRLMFAIKGAMASEALYEMAHRVKRTMLGQLERGYSLGSPPLGYRSVVEFGADGKRKGTRFAIDEKRAEVVRSIFQLRMNGKSLHRIARELNLAGVPTVRESKTWGRSWRSGTVRGVLGNTIYKGVVIWRGSRRSKAGVRDRNHAEESVTFARPELRLVSDEVWERCNSPGRAWKRGGGTCEFAGIARCGECDSVLTVNRTPNGGGSLFCRECTDKVWTGVSERRGGSGPSDRFPGGICGRACCVD